VLLLLLVVVVVPRRILISNVTGHRNRFADQYGVTPSTIWLVINSQEYYNSLVVGVWTIIITQKWIMNNIISYTSL